MCIYSNIHFSKDFLVGINNYFPVTSKEGPQLYYLNLRIIQPPYGIIIDQKAHIQETILAQWFPDTSEKVNFTPTPFKTDITFELTLAETFPDTLSEMHLIEELYLGKFSAHTRKVSILCNTSALISCMLSTVSKAMLMYHQHHTSDGSIASSTTYLDAYIAPSCILLALMALQPMNYVKRFPYATFIIKRYPMA